MKVEDRKFTNLISPYDVRDYKLAGTAIPVVFPETFTLEEVSIKNQGMTGSCVAHACSSVVEYHHNRQKPNKLVFSTEFIYGYRPLGYYVGEGMYVREALKTLQKVGDCPLAVLKGNHEYEKAMENVEENLELYKDAAYSHRISTYVRVYSVEEIKTALMNYGPVIISMPWHKDYKLIDGVYTHKTDERRGNHCVFIYGWTEQGWLIQNSWGRGWGRNGMFILPFDFEWNEAWAITDDIIDDDTIIRPAEKWYIKLFNKIINFIVRTFRK